GAYLHVRQDRAFEILDVRAHFADRIPIRVGNATKVVLNRLKVNEQTGRIQVLERRAGRWPIMLHGWSPFRLLLSTVHRKYAAGSASLRALRRAGMTPAQRAGQLAVRSTWAQHLAILPTRRHAPHGFQAAIAGGMYIVIEIRTCANIIGRQPEGVTEAQAAIGSVFQTQAAMLSAQ